MQQSTLGGDVDREIVAERREHVVHEAAALVHISWILRCQPRKTFTVRELDQLTGERRFMPSRVMELYFYRKGARLERFTPACEPSGCLIRTSRANERRELTRRGAGQRVEPFGARGDVLPSHLRPATSLPLNFLVPLFPLSDARQR